MSDSNPPVDGPALGQKYLDAKAKRIRAHAALASATAAHDKARLDLDAAGVAEKTAEAEYSAALAQA